MGQREPLGIRIRGPVRARPGAGVPPRELDPRALERGVAAVHPARQRGQERRLVAAILAALPGLPDDALAVAGLEEVRPQRGAIRIGIAEPRAAAIERAERLGQEPGDQILEVVLLGIDQLLGPHRGALGPRDRLVGVVRLLHRVEQLVAGQHPDRQRRRRIAVAGEVVLHRDVADAVERPVGAAVGLEVAVGAVEVAEVDVEPIVAAERAVGERRPKPGRHVTGQHLVAAQRDLLDEVRHAVAVGVGGEHRVGSGRDVVDADAAIRTRVGRRDGPGEPRVALGGGGRGRQRERAGRCDRDPRRAHSSAHSIP